MPAIRRRIEARISMGMDAALLLSPVGRIRRRDFWYGFAVVMILSIAFTLIPVAGEWLGLLLLWPQAAIHIKRLHDIGWPGWLLLFPVAVSVICMSAVISSGGAPLLNAPPAALPALVGQASMRTPLLFLEIAFAIELVFLLWVGLTKGDPQANRFGPPPLKPRA